VTLGGADAGNYSVGTAANTTADISPASLTVEADAKSKTVGAGDPPLTFQASGYVGSETAATALSGSLIREPGEAIGSYGILQGSLTAVAGNYVIDYTGAAFQIVDVPPSLSIAVTDAVKAEGHTGTTPFTFTVTRTGDTSGATTVSWAVTGSGVSPADATDFGGSLPSGTVSFGVGETSQTITVFISGDMVVESNEGFTVTLSNPSVPATITTATAAGAILNDDVSVSITAVSADKAEGNSGTSPFTFTVTRTGDTSGTTTVNWAVTGSGASPADAADFGGSLASGTVTFTAGQTSQTITVLVSGDTVVEPDEGFTVTLSNASGPATIATAAASGIIRNDDIPATSQEVWRFDLNTSNPSATQSTGNPTPYTGVIPNDLWDATRGYGWLGSVSSFDRGSSAGSVYSDLLRDGHWGSAPREFRMRVEPGLYYDVTVTFGDASFTRDRLNVSVVTGSGSGLTGVATAAGQFVHRSFTAVPDEQGDLVLRFSDGGGDPYWTVNAV
ncbi:MAG: hypothetical protein KJ000_36425, partial [Pirellulaceae bacterium]|nr:hypothetical protein [Pirellulaceae bacterium]